MEPHMPTDIKYLGPDDVIQGIDEWKEFEKDYYYLVPSCMIGMKIGNSKHSFRRRNFDKPELPKLCNHRRKYKLLVFATLCSNGSVLGLHNTGMTINGQINEAWKLAEQVTEKAFTSE